MTERVGQSPKMTFIIQSGLIFVGGFFLLIFRIGHESLWNDEVMTWVTMTNRDFAQVFNFLKYDVHPPLYYFLIRIYSLIAGNSVFALRFFSVLGTVGLAALGLGPIRRVCGQLTGLLYSCLVFLTPVLVSMSQEGRMYTWATFLTTGAVLYAYLAATEGQKGDWVKVVLFTLGAAYSHYYALITVSGAHLILLGWILKKNRPRFRSYLIMLGVVIIGYLPWALIFIQQLIFVKQKYWIAPITSELIWRILRYPFGDKFDTWGLVPFKIYRFWFMLVLILFGLWDTMRKKHIARWLDLYVFCVAFFTIGSSIIISYLYRPILVERYTIVTLGLLILSLAIGFSSMPKKGFSWALILLFIGLNLPAIFQIYNQRVNGPMAEVVSKLNPIADDTVFVHFDYSWLTVNTFYYYFPAHKHLIVLPNEEERNQNQPILFYPANSVYRGTDVESFIRGHHHVCFVYRTDFTDQEQAVKTAIDSKRYPTTAAPLKFESPYSWYKISVNQLKVD